MPSAQQPSPPWAPSRPRAGTSRLARIEAPCPGFGSGRRWTIKPVTVARREGEGEGHLVAEAQIEMLLDLVERDLAHRAAVEAWSSLRTRGLPFFRAAVEQRLDLSAGDLVSDFKKFQEAEIVKYLPSRAGPHLIKVTTRSRWASRIRSRRPRHARLCMDGVFVLLVVSGATCPRASRATGFAHRGEGYLVCPLSGYGGSTSS